MEQGRRVYVTVPPALYARFEKYGEANRFSFDPAVPLPVELAPGETEYKAETLSTETILSGILRELSGPSPYQEWFDYYRALVNAVRPGILAELTEAAILKAKNGDHDAALEIFDVLLGLFPRHPLILLNRALVLEARAEVSAAGASSKTAGTTPGVDGFASVELAWEDALASPVTDTVFYAGLFYYRQGEYVRAAELFVLYLDEEEAPRSAESQWTSRNRADDKGVENDEDIEDDKGAGNAGESDEDDEKREKARELLEEIRRDGLDNGVFMEACALMRKGEEEKAVLKAREFLERNPRAGKGWFILGWGLRRLSRWKDGAACFAKALECGLDNADTRNEFAICLMETGDYAAARLELEKALRDDPDNVKIISNLGTLALKQGRNAEAESFFRAALELAPGDPVAKVWTAGRL